MIKDDDAKRNIHKERGGPGFSGYPTFPGGYPKNFVDDSYPGRWNYRITRCGQNGERLRRCRRYGSRHSL